DRALGQPAGLDDLPVADPVVATLREQPQRGAGPAFADRAALGDAGDGHGREHRRRVGGGQTAAPSARPRPDNPSRPSEGTKVPRAQGRSEVAVEPVSRGWSVPRRARLALVTAAIGGACIAPLAALTPSPVAATGPDPGVVGSFAPAFQ